MFHFPFIGQISQGIHRACVHPSRPVPGLRPCTDPGVDPGDRVKPWRDGGRDGQGEDQVYIGPTLTGKVGMICKQYYIQERMNVLETFMAKEEQLLVQEVPNIFKKYFMAQTLRFLALFM